MFCSEKRPQMKMLYPSLSMVEISKKLGEAWKLLSEEDKKEYKENENIETCDISDFVESTSRQYGEAGEEPEPGQSTLLSCHICGKIYYRENDLRVHISGHIETEADLDLITLEEAVEPNIGEVNNEQTETTEKIHEEDIVDITENHDENDSIKVDIVESDSTTEIENTNDAREEVI